MLILYEVIETLRILKATDAMVLIFVVTYLFLRWEYLKHLKFSHVFILFKVKSWKGMDRGDKKYISLSTRYFYP